MKVYDAKSYIEFVSYTLMSGHDVIPRGRVKELAHQLQCHASFVSQILGRKADMSHEQALRFCSFVKFGDDEAEFFVDLLNHDRAATKDAKTHFRRILRRKLLERQSIEQRNRLAQKLSREQEILYFQSITHSLVHATLHLKQTQQVHQISSALNLPEREISESLLLLKELGLADQHQEIWSATHKVLHVGKESPLNRTYHANWRLKSAAQLLEGKRTQEHTHFSSVYCIAHEDVERIRELLLNHLELVRKEMVASSSERLFALCLDYFPV